MKARKTIGIAIVCGVLISVFSALGALPSTTASVEAQETTPPETCSVCHKDAGDKHQASYDALYQDGVIKVTNLAYSFSAPNTTVVTFKTTKNGAPFNANDADSLAIRFVPYTGE